MNFRLGLATLISLVASSNASSTPEFMMQGKGKKSKSMHIPHGASIPADSEFGSALMSQARSLDNANMDFSFIGQYSIKFQGCHHINQWNENADDGDDVRILTKRLVRFRLCPSNMCQDYKTAGCSSHYGDYVVDMNLYVDTYLQSVGNMMEYQCQKYEEVCQEECDGNDDMDACEVECYDNYGVSYCYGGNMGDDSTSSSSSATDMIDPVEYSYCAQMNFQNRDDDDSMGYEYYVGPYCGEQGGEINLGLFTDDTCTTFASGGKSLFYEYAGYQLPYASDNMISEECFSCMEAGADDDAAEWNDQMDEDNVKEMCLGIYQGAGKCETKMAVDYPNEAACTYIEGVKIIREDGVIRTTSVKKSRAAAVTIGLFTTIAVLLGSYVYYLRTSKFLQNFYNLYISLTSVDLISLTLRLFLYFSTQNSAEQRSVSHPKHSLKSSEKQTFVLLIQVFLVILRCCIHS